MSYEEENIVLRSITHRLLKGENVNPVNLGEGTQGSQGGIDTQRLKSS